MARARRALTNPTGSRVAALVFLKLGGALLTDKHEREAIRQAVLARLAREIAAWPGAHAGRLLVAHGSGSFGHVAARETGFLDHPADAMAHARVAAAAARLNAAVVDALIAAGLPAVAVPGGLVATCDAGRVAAVRADLVADRLAARLVPVTYGDAALDRSSGGTIASTEPLLAALAGALRPDRIVLATDVDGVYDADPHARPGARRFDRLTPVDRDRVAAALAGARAGAVDVTGGMASKVGAMLDAVARQPGLEVRIVSGLRPGAVGAALAGADDAGGTVIQA